VSRSDGSWPPPDRAHPSSQSPPEKPFLALVAAAVLVGLGAGVAGTGLVCLLHLVQHAAYGYEVGSALDAQTFLEGVSAAPPARRVAALTVSGLLAGVGWSAIHRFGRPLVSVEDAVQRAAPMPLVSTVAHVLLQILTISLGSPLGREVAPRELGALGSAWLSERAGFSREQRRLLVACGAGAGLAAVYNVPFGGALFTLEVLLGTFRLQAVVAAMVSSGLAGLLMKVLLHNPRIYELPRFTVAAPLVAWSIVTGPIFGIAGTAFYRVASVARERAPRGVAVLAWCLPVFLGIGLLAIAYPELLGNGRSAAQISFDGSVTMKVAAALLVLRFVATTASLRAGAKGGLLTPSIALGALLGTLLGGLFSLAWSGASSSAFALVGATAFLAASQKMPLTAIVLIAEFARIDHDMLFPILLGVGGSAAAASAAGERALSPGG
jgi:H+/Cl- antiporter ClcA